MNPSAKPRALLAAVFAVLCACPPAHAAELAREPRSVAEVRRVVLRGVADLLLRQGATAALEVEAERHLLPRMTSELRDGTLYLDTSGFVHTSRPLRFHLTLAQLESLVSEGSGEASVSPLSASELSLVAAGSGALRIESLAGRQLRAKLLGSAQIEIAGGRVEEQRIAIEGSGDYRAADLASEHAVVGISGSGSAQVSARNKVNASIYGSGEVAVHGNARIEQAVAGAGTVTRRGR